MRAPHRGPKPRWNGAATDKQRARELRKQFDAVWTDEAGHKADALARELRVALRKVDAAHNAALWHEVRELFDYPVFTAAPAAVGITSTGAEGPNQLPEVLVAYRKFAAWVEGGAKPVEAPVFAEPEEEKRDRAQ
jgi:type I restriction enzyme M protein